MRRTLTTLAWTAACTAIATGWTLVLAGTLHGTIETITWTTTALATASAFLIATSDKDDDHD